MEVAKPPSWPRIRREAYPYVAGFGFLSLVLGWLWAPLLWPGIGVAILTAYIFRDPDRAPPSGRGAVLSPADGTVASIEPAVAPAELRLGSEKRIRVAVRTGPLDVRVNRAPLAGRVAQLDRRKASNQRAAEVEEEAITIEGDESVGVVRRGMRLPGSVRSLVAAGDRLNAGDRFGLLALGSEVEIYLPAGTEIVVAPGQTAVAGETVIARLAGPREPTVAAQ